MVHIDNERENINTAQREWDSSIEFGERSNTYKLVRALLSEADRIDDDLEEIYHSHHINNATGEELEEFGQLINTPRNTGESDEKYRTRVKTNFAQAKTQTTYDSFVEFTATILATAYDNLEFETNYSGNPATVVVRADASVFDNLQITNQEAVDLIGGGIPAGHEVLVEESGTFRLKVDGDTDEADKGLTSDGINTGGTLAQDVI